jgi:galactoside O-acetyltransferase
MDKQDTTTTGGVPVVVYGDGRLVYNFGAFGAGARIFDWCVVLKPEVIHVGRYARLDSFVKLEGGLGLWIGDYVHISSFCHVNIGGGEMIIGDFAALASGAKVLGGSNTTAGRSMSAAAPAEMQVVERSRTVIEPYAFLGVNSVVLPGLTVGEGAIVGAGAVVTADVPPGEVWAGVPARRIGYRARN